MFLPGESQGRGSLADAVYGVTGSDTTDVSQQQQMMISDPMAILENINCIYFNKVCNFVLELLKKTTIKKKKKL